MEDIEIFGIPKGMVFTDKPLVLLYNNDDGFIAVAGNSIEGILKVDISDELDVYEVFRAEGQED